MNLYMYIPYKYIFFPLELALDQYTQCFFDVFCFVANLQLTIIKSTNVNPTHFPNYDLIIYDKPTKI